MPDNNPFVHAFSNLPDPRIDRNKLHNLIDIIVISIIAVTCKAEGWEDIEDFAMERVEWLKTFLELPNGVPTHDTFRRVLSKINKQIFQECVINLFNTIHCELEHSQIAIDGKSLRRSFDTATEQSALHLVQAFATDVNLVLAQLKVDKKENEIVVIPDILRMLSMEGATVTIDAMGCQKKIAKIIVQEKKSDYILALKKNQKTLHNETKALFRLAESNNYNGFAHDQVELTDGGHGRVETRRCTCLDATPWLDALPEGWVGLRTLVRVESTREIGDKKQVETRYYISSLPCDASRIGALIRGHWAIENSLHWVLDVTFREDESRIRKDNGPEVFAMMRRLALGLIKHNKPEKMSLKKAQFKALMNPQFASKLLFGI